MLDLDHAAVGGDELSEPLDRARATARSRCRRSAARARASASASSLRSVSAIRCSRNCAARAGRRCGPRARGAATRAPPRGPRSRPASRRGRGRRRPRPARRHRAPAARRRARRSAPARRRCGPTRSRCGAVETLELGLQLAALPEHAGEALGRGGEAGVVLVEPAFERMLVLARPVERGAAVGERLLGGRRKCRLGGGRALTGLVERGRRRTARRPHRLASRSAPSGRRRR